MTAIIAAVDPNQPFVISPKTGISILIDPWTKRTVTTLLVLALLGCEVDASKPLGDGYLHAETDAYNTWVVHGSEFVVDSNVTKALAIDEYIVGLRVKPQQFVDLRENELSNEYGYFLFDKSTGVLIQGLSEGEIEEVFEKNAWDFGELDSATL